jgi:hypothetical protein
MSPYIFVVLVTYANPTTFFCFHFNFFTVHTVRFHHTDPAVASTAAAQNSVDTGDLAIDRELMHMQLMQHSQLQLPLPSAAEC